MNASLSRPLGLLLRQTGFGQVALAVVASTTLAYSSQSATWVVTNLNDGGRGSLRAAIATAASHDTVVIKTSGTISLTNGELFVSKYLDIKGPGPENLIISGNTQSRVFRITKHARLSLFGVSVCDGRAPDGATGTSNSPAAGNGSDGGGIYNAGVLTMTGCVISNCAAGHGGTGYMSPLITPEATNWIGGFGGRGGAIYNTGKLLLTGSVLISNSSGPGGDAGGALQYGAAGNSGGGGGAIYNAGAMILRGCAFERNVAGNGGSCYSPIYDSFENGKQGGAGGDGGALYDATQTTTSIVDCQFSSNTSGAGATGGSGITVFSQRPALGGSGGTGGAGGAIWADGLVRMKRCTFLSNQTGRGGAGGRGSPDSGAGGSGGSGAAICAIGAVTLTHCSCASNHAASGGDGGFSHAGRAGSAGTGGSGGAVYVEGPLRLKHCIFTGNSAGSGGQGGSVPARQQYGYPTAGSGGIGGSGGALYCQSDLAGTNCTFDSNQAGDAGGPGATGFNPSFNHQDTTSGANGGQAGAISCAGPVVLHACTVSRNRGGNGTSADPSGTSPFLSFKSYKGTRVTGGTGYNPKIIIYTWDGRPGGAGGAGGIYSQKSLRMALCTLSGNGGGAGGNGGDSGGGYFENLLGGAGGAGGTGAVHCSTNNELSLIACTLAGNSGGPGGSGGQGVSWWAGHSYNGAGGPGGVGGVLSGSSAISANLGNTLIAANLGGPGGADGSPYGPAPVPAPHGTDGAPDLQGAFTSLGHNLIGQEDGSSGFENGVNGDNVGSGASPVNPLLGPLSQNGSTTAETMALLHGSPAIDSGDDSLLRPPYHLETDQRGFWRRSGVHVDIGAFEAQFRASPPILINGDMGEVGAFDLSFTNHTPGATFSVLGTTNAGLPVNGWRVLGAALEIAPGQFTFSDAQATNFPQRFYRLRSP